MTVFFTHRLRIGAAMFIDFGIVGFSEILKPSTRSSPRDPEDPLILGVSL